VGFFIINVLNVFCTKVALTPFLSSFFFQLQTSSLEGYFVVISNHVDIIQVYLLAQGFPTVVLDTPATFGRRGFTLLPSFVQELDSVCYDFNDFSFLPVLSFVGSGLESPFHCHQPAFTQIIGTGFGQLSPGYNIDKIGVSFPHLIGKWPVDSKREPAYCDPVRGVPHFRITGQASNQYDTV